MNIEPINFPQSTEINTLLDFPSNLTTSPFFSPSNSSNNPSNLAPDPNDSSRLLGNDIAELVNLIIGELNSYPDGLWLLGGDDTVTGSMEGELIRLNDGNDFVDGQGGQDTLYGGKQNDQVKGGNDNDQLKGDLGKDILEGGLGDDILRGGRDNDHLLGGDGNDFLVGDKGQDILTGGSHQDTFVLKVEEATNELNQVDIITDFDWFRDDDKIALTQGLNANDLDLTNQIDFDQIGGSNDTLIKLKSSGSLLAVVLNVDAFDLDQQFIIADPMRLTL